MTASDASPSKPTETLEEKIEEKIEQKVEAKLEQKVEDKVESKPVEEPPPEVKPAPNPEVAIEPPPPQEVQQETPKRQEPRPPAPTTSAPQSMPEQTAAIPAAPTQGKLKPSTSNAVPTWLKQVALLLERTIRYPEAADRRGQSGVVQVSFSLDRQGRLVDSRIVRSSGVAALDEEALALLRRAQPLPPPPPEFPGEPVTFNVPIRFLPHGASPDVKR
jgi:periplasmic protein TonB